MWHNFIGLMWIICQPTLLPLKTWWKDLFLAWLKLESLIVKITILGPYLSQVWNSGRHETITLNIMNNDWRSVRLSLMACLQGRLVSKTLSLGYFWHSYVLYVAVYTRCRNVNATIRTYSGIYLMHVIFHIS